MNILLTEKELPFFMSALRQQRRQTWGLDPLQMSAAQLENVNTCETIASKVFGSEMGDPEDETLEEFMRYTYNFSLTEDEVSYLIAIFREMLGHFAYDAEYSEHRLSLEGSSDPPIGTLLNDNFCHQLASKLGHRI